MIKKVSKNFSDSDITGIFALNFDFKFKRR